MRPGKSWCGTARRAPAGRRRVAARGVARRHTEACGCPQQCTAVRCSVESFSHGRAVQPKACGQVVAYIRQRRASGLTKCPGIMRQQRRHAANTDCCLPTAAELTHGRAARCSGMLWWTCEHGWRSCCRGLAIYAWLVAEYVTSLAEVCTAWLSCASIPCVTTKL